MLENLQYHVSGRHGIRCARMIRKERCLIMDLDGTLCQPKQPGQEYSDLEPNPEVLRKLREYRAQGFGIAFYTSRNMRTYEGNLGQITAHTLPVIIEWLRRHDVPFDELHIGKPWPGRGGFYVDDKCIRPDEFVSLSYAEIQDLIGGSDSLGD